MPTLSNVVRLASELLSLQREKSLSSLIRPARLVLAVLGGFALLSLSQFVMMTQGRVQAARPFHPGLPGQVILAATQSYSGATFCDVVSGGSGPDCDYADLAVEKTVSDSTPEEGDTIVYVVTVTNHGPRNASSIELTDELPVGVSYITHTVSQGTYTNTWWTMPGLANGANATLTITATVDTGTSGQTITNTATGLVADQADENSGNNQASAVILVEGLIGADLGVTKVVNDPTPAPGDVITYTVAVVNHGPEDAASVQLSDELPIGVTYITHTVSQGVYTNSLWTVGRLDNTQNATLTITVTVDSGTSGEAITNTANIFSSVPSDPIIHNNKASARIDPISASYCLYLPLILKPSPPPCFVETFDDPYSAWHFDSSPGPPTLLEYLNGQYHMFTQDTSVSHWARSRRGSFYDYLVQVDVRWANSKYTGEGHGIVFGMTGSGSNLNYYRFNINTDTDIGTFVLDEIQGNSRRRLVSAQSPDILTGTVTNTLRVDHISYSIDLYINGEYQLSCPDDNSCPEFGTPLPRPGYMGVDIVPYDHINSEAYFDNFTICSYELNEASIGSLAASPGPAGSGVGSK